MEYELSTIYPKEYNTTASDTSFSTDIFTSTLLLKSVVLDILNSSLIETSIILGKTKIILNFLI